MTSHELARKLLEGPDLLVTVRGYEGGVDEITHVSGPLDLALNYYEEWYYGKHEPVDSEYSLDDAKQRGLTIVKSIHVG